MAIVGMLNKDAVIAMIRSASAEMAQAVDAQLHEEADGLAEAVQAAAPVRSGVLQASVRVEEGSEPGFLAVAVGAEPQTRKAVRAGVKAGDFQAARLTGDRSGEYDYPLGVEFGHKTPEGAHVPAEPFLFPTYRARKAGMRSRMRRAVATVLKKYTLGGQ